MNKVIEQLQNHRTYRDFDEAYQLNDSELEAILAAARQAPTWMNGQFYSIIVIRDTAIREQLVAWNPTNPHMRKSSVFLLFVGDLNRTARASKMYEKEYVVDGIEPILLATTDAALALENTVVAVESLGLGSVVVGSIRKFGQEISELLELPDYTFPLFGLSIGKPIVEMEVKPRLPEKAVVHYDKFTEYDDELIAAYDQTMEIFGEARETKKWSLKFADFFSVNPVPKTTDALLRAKKLLD